MIAWAECCRTACTMHISPAQGVCKKRREHRVCPAVQWRRTSLCARTHTARTHAPLSTSITCPRRYPYTCRPSRVYYSCTALATQRRRTRSSLPSNDLTHTTHQTLAPHVFRAVRCVRRPKYQFSGCPVCVRARACSERTAPRDRSKVLGIGARAM